MVAHDADPVRLDPNQWDAARAVDRHILVAAGAGTGKTSTVVGRILYLLGVPLRGERNPAPVSLDRIAAITFTNAAAADLRKKVRDALRTAGRHAEAFQVDTARIGTIHAFAGDLLREFALRAGRAPGLAVLEEGESRLLTTEVVQEALIDGLTEAPIEGLAELLAERGVERVAGWVERLLREADRLPAWRAGRIGPREQALLALADRALARLHRRLDDAGATDFDRMLLWARDLLRLPEVCRVLQRRLHTLIVDEFQDVDPVQRDLAYLLGDPASGRADTTRLMLVGDPKQSIYRFRQADVTVWTGVQRDFRDQGFGRVIPLERNYRSVAPVLGFVDAVIGPVLDLPISGGVQADFEVPFASVRATRTDGPADEAVELILHPAAGPRQKISADDARRREAAVIAARALELRQQRGRWGGMALLLGSWTSAAIYEEALQAVGAPTYALQQEGFYRRQEVVDLLVALEAIRDPRNDIALFGFLRGPFVGVRDETLLELALQGRGPQWDRLPGYQGGEAELVARGLALLGRFGALRDRIPTAELLERLLVEGGYLAHLALFGEDGRQRIANVRKLVRLARASAQGGVGDFVRQLRAAREHLDREGGARLFGEQDDVVTITSIHSAKGLQWDVVFWADLSRQPVAARSEGLLLSRDRMLIEGAEDPDAAEAAKTLTELLRREGRAERKRLWYVAATRARDRLIVSGFELEKQPSGSAASELVPQLASRIARGGGRFHYDGQDGSFTGRVHQTAGLDAEPAPVAGTVLDPAATLARPLPRLPVPLGQLRHSATEFLAWSRCPERHYLRYVAGIREPAIKGGRGAREDAVRRGVIVHDVLERLREEAELELLLEDAIRRHDPEAPPEGTTEGVEYRDRIRTEVAAVETQPEYRALADAPGARRELGFIALVGGGDRIEGKMDLAAPLADGIVLLDVKTGRVPRGDAGAHAAHYAPQRDAYVTAAEAISGLPVSRFAFQFSQAGMQYAEMITDEHRREARRRQGEMLRAIGDGSRGRTAHPEECRFCGFRSAGWCPGVAG